MNLIDSKGNEGEEEIGSENTATTISTIAIRAEPHTTIVIAMLKTIGLVELRIDEMRPKLLEIGENLSEATELLNKHNDLYSRLMSKQQQVEELLGRAAHLVHEQKTSNDVIVYKAMAESLALAWKDLNRQLQLRGYILDDTFRFYELTHQQAHLTKQTNDYLRDAINAEKEISAPNISKIVEQSQTSINELIGVTVEGVELGLNIITQIRVLGSLADNDDRPSEVVNSCLIIEHEMLKLAQEWEMINTFWSGEQARLKEHIKKSSEDNNVTLLSTNSLTARLNAAEAWLEAAEQTLKTTSSSTTAKLLRREVLNQKNSLKILRLPIQDTSDNSQRHENLLKRFDAFALRLESFEKTNANRVDQFLQNSKSMLNQLAEMRADLVNANASMAGELGPLARQKVRALIDEGESILRADFEDSEHALVAQKLSALRDQLAQLEQLVQERIAEAKASLLKIQDQLQSLNVWLSEYAEPFISRNNYLGKDAKSCANFVTRYKEFSVDVLNREPEILSVLNSAQAFFSSNSDKKYLEDFRRRYEQLRYQLDTRQQLSGNFEKVLKFSKDLDLSFDTLSNLLDSNHGKVLNADINIQIRNVFQIVKATLKQEAHQSEKFINDAKNINNKDANLKCNDASEAVKNLVESHEKRLAEITAKWEKEEENQNEHKNAVKIIEEVQMWQIETNEAIQRITSPEFRQQESETTVQNKLESILAECPTQNRKLSTASQISKTLPFFEHVEQEQKNIENAVNNALKQHEINKFTKNQITEETEFFERDEFPQVPLIIEPLKDSQVEEGERFEFCARIASSPETRFIWLKNDSGPLQNTIHCRTAFLNGFATLTIPEASLEDSAVYTLRAENALGAVETCATLIVKSKSHLDVSNNPSSGNTSPFSLSGVPQKPHFVKPLQTKNVSLGDTAVLDCVVVALPEPKVIWYKEETTIQESDRIHLHFRGDHCSLRISNVGIEDSGLYKIKAVNSIGETVNFCRLNVASQQKGKQPPPTAPKPATSQVSPPLIFHHSQPPTFMSDPLANLVLNEGENAVFQIQIEGIPTPKISWFFQDRLLSASDSEFKIFTDSNGWNRLVIDQITPQHAGIYIVVAENECGEARSGASLNVNQQLVASQPIPYRAVNYYDEENVHEVNSQSTANMPKHLMQGGGYMTEKIYTSAPPPIPIHRGTNPTENQQPFEYVENFGDMGYSSLANAPQLLRPFQSEYTVNEGERVQIDCLMLGNPRPRIHWFFNDRPIQSNYQFAELTNIGDTYAIAFNPAKLENAGYYRMTAENIRGKTESVTLIHVRPRSMIPQPVQTNKIKKTQSLEQRRMMEEFNSMSRGTSALATKKPPSATRQNFQQEPQMPLKMSTSLYQPKHTFAQDYGLQNVQSSTPQTYNKQIYENKSNYYDNQQNYESNKMFAQQTPSQQTSNVSAPNSEAGRKGVQPPHFLQTLVSSVAIEEETAIFEAIITGLPTPQVEWSKDGVILKGDNSRIHFSSKAGRAILNVEKVQAEDSGKYMCTARNDSGVATSSAQLVIRSRMVAPDFIQRLISEEAVEGQRLQWTVKVVGEPEPKVTWLRDGQRIPNCEEVKLIRDEMGKYSMIIECLELADGGQFTCLLENEAGEARSTADLLVRSREAKPGSYFHVTKCTQEKQLKGEEVSRNEIVTIQNPNEYKEEVEESHLQK